MRTVTFLVLVLVATPALAQESQFHADLRREGEHIASSCGRFDPKALFGCLYSVTTENPFHVTFGSLAPQSGFAYGLAFAEHLTPNESWRLSWNADAVATPSGSWRGGLYMKIVHTPATAGVVVRQPGSAPGSGAVAPRELAVVDVFVQSISLETLDFFGAGPQSLESGRSVYGERQTIVGASAVYPLGLKAIAALHPALIGEVAGRFVAIRRATSDQAPSIQQVYDESTAPGVSQQKAFVQFREGVRLKPSLPSGWLRFNYLLSAEQFRTSSQTRSSFNRWTIDLRHEIPLYRGVSSTGPRPFNGPNECAQAVGSAGCPPVQWSRNREGSISFRLLVSTSTTGDGNRVPFYFQPTLGGSNLDGERLLAGYQDYRFRGPDLLALQEGVEHSLWGPVGAFVLLEQGKVALHHSDLNLKGLATSATVGVTLRAGGFPMVTLSFSWSGEGNHIIGSMNSTLLGGSLRPSLY